jgi:hypothetical protein
MAKARRKTRYAAATTAGSEVDFPYQCMLKLQTSKIERPCVCFRQKAGHGGRVLNQAEITLTRRVICLRAAVSYYSGETGHAALNSIAYIISKGRGEKKIHLKLERPCHACSCSGCADTALSCLCRECSQVPARCKLHSQAKMHLVTSQALLCSSFYL